MGIRPPPVSKIRTLDEDEVVVEEEACRVRGVTGSSGVTEDRVEGRSVNTASSAIVGSGVSYHGEAGSSSQEDSSCSSGLISNEIRFLEVEVVGLGGGPTNGSDEVGRVAVTRRGVEGIKVTP